MSRLKRYSCISKSFLLKGREYVGFKYWVVVLMVPLWSSKVPCGSSVQKLPQNLFSLCIAICPFCMASRDATHTINRHSLKRLAALTPIMLESVNGHSCAQHQGAFYYRPLKYLFIYSSRMTLIDECLGVVCRHTTNSNRLFENFLQFLAR